MINSTNLTQKSLTWDVRIPISFNCFNNEKLYILVSGLLLLNPSISDPRVPNKIRVKALLVSSKPSDSTLNILDLFLSSLTLFKTFATVERFLNVKSFSNLQIFKR